MNITNPSFNPVHVFSKHIFTKDYTKLETPQKFAVFALYILANIPTFGLINIHLYCKFRATLIKSSQTPVPSNLFKQRVKSSSANQGLQLAASVPVAKRVEMSEFQQYSGGATSDHAWRTFNASVKNKKDVTFSVKYGTWNLLNKCTSPNKHSGFGNNPMNLKEKDNDYTIRKLTQIEEIRRLIKGGKFGETDVEPVDTLLFQEIDFYQEKKEPFLTVYKAFKQMLKDEGWSMKGTDPKIPTKIQDPFVVIYNPKKLVTENIFLDGCFQQKNKNLGAEGTFQRILKEYPRILSPKFQLASVHLGFQVQIPSDPRSIQNMENKTNSDIASYQKKQLENNVLKDQEEQLVVSDGFNEKWSDNYRSLLVKEKRLKILKRAMLN